MRCAYCGCEGDGTFCSLRCEKLQAFEKRSHKKLYTVLGVIALALLLLGFALSHKAHAHNPDTHQEDDLSKAASDAYGICCDGKDYLRIQTWETTATGWRILVKGHWMDVSRRAKVSNMDNPDGEAKAWINGVEGAYYVRCFMPGTLSATDKFSMKSYS